MIQNNPFANMVPLDQMEEEIAYQMACDQGLNPKIYLDELIDEKEQALKGEANEVIDQLRANVTQAISLFNGLLAEMRGSQPYRAVDMQITHLTASLGELDAHKENTLKILDTLHQHLLETIAQQRTYQEKLAALQAAKKKEQADLPFATFLNQCGENYRQTMINRSAGITPPPAGTPRAKHY